MIDPGVKPHCEATSFLNQHTPMSFESIQAQWASLARVLSAHLMVIRMDLRATACGALASGMSQSQKSLNLETSTRMLRSFAGAAVDGECRSHKVFGDLAAFFAAQCIASRCWTGDLQNAARVCDTPNIRCERLTGAAMADHPCGLGQMVLLSGPCNLYLAGLVCFSLCCFLAK